MLVTYDKEVHMSHQCSVVKVCIKGHELVLEFIGSCKMKTNTSPPGPVIL